MQQHDAEMQSHHHGSAGLRVMRFPDKSRKRSFELVEVRQYSLRCGDRDLIEERSQSDGGAAVADRAPDKIFQNRKRNAFASSLQVEFAQRRARQPKKSRGVQFDVCAIVPEKSGAPMGHEEGMAARLPVQAGGRPGSAHEGGLHARTDHSRAHASGLREILAGVCWRRRGRHKQFCP
jgi:hypothetical protein